MTQRTAIYDALCTLFGKVVFDEALAGNTTWVGGVQRRLKLWGDVAPELQPYCCITMHKETYKQQSKNLPPIRLIPAFVYIYIQTGDPGSSVISGTEVLNMVQDAIDVILQPDNRQYGTLTLGGLCDRCYLDGDQFADPGDLDGTAMLILSVSILLP